MLKKQTKLLEKYPVSKLETIVHALDLNLYECIICKKIKTVNKFFGPTRDRERDGTTTHYSRFCKRCANKISEEDIKTLPQFCINEWFGGKNDIKKKKNN